MTKTTTDTAQAPQAPGLFSDALETAINAARIASPIVTGPDGQLHLMLPEGFRTHTLPADNRLAPWPRQHVVVDDRASLVGYINRHGSDNSVIIADFDKGEISARLDWHPHNDHEDAGAAGPDSHAVTLKLRPSEEFSRWNAVAGKLMAQDEFARFLEENASDVVMPEASTMIEISRDFEASVGQTYKSSVRLDNGDRRLVFETDTRAQNGVIVPHSFTLAIPIYNGEEPDQLTCLFRWRAAGDGQVRLGFEWHRVEYQRRAHFTLIATAAAEATGKPAFMGRATS